MAEKRRGRPRKNINNEIIEEATVEEQNEVVVEEQPSEEFESPQSEPQQEFEKQDKYEGTKGNYNPFDKDVFEREYSTPKTAEGLTDDIPEPDFNSNPSFEDLMNENKVEEEPEPSPFDNPNPAINDLPLQEKQIACEQMVDTVLDTYESLTMILKNLVTFSDDKLNQMIINDEIDPNTIIPTENGDVSLQEFVGSYNEQAREVMSHDRSFNQKVRPAMVREFMKRGWAMSDMQTIGFHFGKDFLTKTTQLFGLKKSINGTFDLLKEMHSENQKQKKSKPKRSRQKTTSFDNPNFEQEYEFERQQERVQNTEPMNIVNEQDLNNFETEKTNFQTFQRPEENSHPTLVQEEMDKANEEAEAKKESEE